MDEKGQILAVYGAVLLILWGVYLSNGDEPRGGGRGSTLESMIPDYLMEAEREPVSCEFEKPISIIVGVMTYHDNYEDVNIAYQQTYAADPDKEVWGFSICEWQPENNYAACDIHTVLPEFVEEDLAMNTIGHEFWHGACGDFHE